MTKPEPEVREPSDEEIMGLMPQQMHEDLATAARAMAEQAGADSTRVKGAMRIILNRHVVDLAHAAIAADRARYGRPAPAPAGEVAELVAWLRAWARGTLEEGQPATSRSLTRAAALLEQRHPAPVPVAERLPGPEDCDAEGRCWTYEGKHLPSYMTGPWVLREPPKVSDYLPKVSDYFWRNVTHWLPFNALPLPSGEVDE